MKKKVFATLLAVSMIASMVPAAVSVQAADGDSIRLVNGKIEVDAQLKKLAEMYEKETGTKVEIESMGGGIDIQGTLKGYYQSDNMPDIFVNGSGADFANWTDMLVDMSDQEWASDTDAAYVDESQGTIGFPYTTEAIGLAYNKDILDKAGIDPSTLTSPDAIKEAFETIDSKKDELGLTSVCAVAAESGQMYWSTGNHLLAAYYSQGVDRDDKTYIDMVNNEGKIDEDRMGQFADWLQLLFDYSDQNVLISGTYDDQLALWATGKAAFITQGNWIDPSLPTYDATFACGLAPSAFTKEDTDGLIVDTPSLWGIYNKSDKIDACKEFLKALAESEEGQKALVENCGMVSPFKSCTLKPSTPLAQSMLPYIESGKTYAWDWVTQPDNMAMNATGPVFELYAKGQLDKEGFVSTMASSIADYVASSK